MNSPAKTADQSAPKSASANSPLTIAERDWMLSLSDSELKSLLKQVRPESRKKLLDELRDHRTPKERAEASLHEFVRQAWHTVEPDTPFIDNWHIAALCQHLEAATRVRRAECGNPSGVWSPASGVGELDSPSAESEIQNHCLRTPQAVPSATPDSGRQTQDSFKQPPIGTSPIKQLLINIPPGCMKSLLCAVFWPAWVWGPLNRPETRWLFISYAQPLSIRDAVRARRLIESPWYQQHWGKVFTFVDDQNQKMRYETDHGGWRVSTSNGGIGTGEHPDFLVADDFFNSDQCDSETERKSGLDWWDGTTTTRGITRDVRRVVIGQRFHEEDLSGHLLAEGGWDHICLPMEFEPGRMPPTSLGWTDPRTEPGELLWPALFTESQVRNLTRKLRPHRAAGQLQQWPSAPQGELFQLRMVPHNPRARAAAESVRRSPRNPLLGQSRHGRGRRVHSRRPDGQARPAVVRARRETRPMGGPRPRTASH